TPNQSVTQLPYPQRRHPVPQHVRRVRPKTYSVAVYLVFAVVLLQVVMVISVFWLRAMVVSVNVNPPNALTGASGNPSPLYQPNGPGMPHTGVTAKNPDMTVLPALEMTATHPALLRVPKASD